MIDIIVDTNVAVVANRQNVNVATQCADACVVFLAQVPKNNVVLIDCADEIRTEYASALLMKRPYELGAQFLIYVIQNQFDPSKVRRVELERGIDGEFADFPKVPALATFDPSDRKFAALSRKESVAVTNAVDSDWANSLPALVANGIAVEFLCGCDQAMWFTA